MPSRTIVADAPQMLALSPLRGLRHALPGVRPADEFRDILFSHTPSPRVEKYGRGEPLHPRCASPPRMKGRMMYTNKQPGLYLRLTSEEKADLEQKARAVNASKGEYLRTLLKAIDVASDTPDTTLFKYDNTTWKVCARSLRENEEVQIQLLENITLIKQRIQNIPNESVVDTKLLSQINSSLSIIEELLGSVSDRCEKIQKTFDAIAEGECFQLPAMDQILEGE